MGVASLRFNMLNSASHMKQELPMPVTTHVLDHKQGLDTESCWALLLRVVASPQMKRAARMREFLMFVGQRTLREGCDQVHEQEIGSHVFGRPPGYDTSFDNIVRVNATDLRKRVDDYFATDGLNEPVVFEIPRGSYRPIFRPRTRVESPVPQTQVAIEPVPALVDLPIRIQSANRLPMIVAGAVIAALATACCILWIQNASMHRALYAWKSTTSVGSFWSGILDARPNTDIILADTTFALIEDITKRPIPLNAYLSRDYVSEIQSPGLSPDRRDDLQLIAQRRFGSLGDFRAAQQVVALDPLGKNLRIYYARDYRPTLAKQDNLILIGSRKSNPWVDLFVSKLNFTVEYDPNRYVSFIKNHAPIAGEQDIYTTLSGPESNGGYSAVAYLPNPDQGGKAVILAGTTSEATESAADFLTSETAMANFLGLLHVKQLPYFEVLLKTSHLNGTPMDAQIVAYRTYPGLH